MDVLQGTHFASANRFRIGRASRRFGLIATFLLAGLLAACGGGGGSGTASTNQEPISGYVVKGPTAGATVNLFSVVADGTKTLLATTTTNASGFYHFGTTPARDTVLLVESSGGTYPDEITTVHVPLGGTLRAVAVASGTPLRMSASPFSEIAVREIESANVQDWGGAHVNSVGAALSDTIGVGNILAFKPVDMRNLSDIQTSSDDDYFLSIALGGFTGMLHRMGSPSNPASLAQGIAALRTVTEEDNDDQYSPIYLKGWIDFIDVTALPADSRRRLKGSLLLQNENASDAEIAAAMPTGQASGSASAPMPNNAFALITDLNMNPQWPMGTIFNSRGALIAYDIGPVPPAYRYLYSGSVGELYGDGEIGIGRWHGGMVFDATDGPALDTLVNPQVLSAESGVSYAVAAPATNSPTCGSRTLSLVGSTMPIRTFGPGDKPVVGLTADSRMGVQYAGASAFVGFDIGLQLSDGSVFRVSTPGGATSPWRSHISTNAQQSFSIAITPLSSPPLLPGLSVYANGVLAGAGGGKASLIIQIYLSPIGPETLAAAFSSDSAPGTDGCAVSSPGDGTAIVPPPTDGAYFAFAGTDNTNTLFGTTPLPVTAFSANGSLLKSGFDVNQPILNIPAGTPAIELAGNAYATIGRIQGPFKLNGIDYNRSLPYAIAQPPGTLLTTGTRRYALRSSSSVIATFNSAGALFEIQGQIARATLDINFGENPSGTPNSPFGSARVLIEGSVGGTNFSISNPVDTSGMVSDYFYNQDTGAFCSCGAPPNYIQGVVSGSNAEYAVLRYTTTVNDYLIQGVLLLQSQ